MDEEGPTGYVRSFILNKPIPAGSVVNIHIRPKDGSDLNLSDFVSKHETVLEINEPKYTL